MLDLTQPKDAHIERRLRTDPIIWLSSVRPDGRPHIVAVWFLWDGATFLIFSKPANQKIRNLRHSPHVMLALDGTNQGGDVIIIAGQAALIDDSAVTATMPAYAEKYAALIASMQWSAEAMAASYTQAIRITPTKFLQT